MNDNGNNNLNGTILGNVDNNQNLTTSSISNDDVETLDSGMVNTNNTMTDSQMSNQNLSSQSQNTFFTNPPISDNVISNQSGINETPHSPATIVNEVPPIIEPTPAYTNLQNINPNPMPGFEAPGTIGTTPPISFEPEKKPKKKSNKILFIIIVLVALAAVGFGTYYVLNYTDLLEEKEQVTVTIKDLQYNLGDSLSANINDYAAISGTDTRNCSLNTTNVNVNALGIYEYTITCGDIVKTGKVTIVDNTKLVVETKVVYKVKGDTIEASEFAKETDETLTFEFVEPEVVNNLLAGDAGNYTIKLRVTSQNNKVAEVEASLIVTEYAIKGYYTCSSEGQNITDSSAVMTVSEQFAIVNDGNNGYGKIAYEIYSFKFSDETEYTSYLASYKTDNSITINNITGDTEFNDETLTITITNPKANDLVISEYGETNMEKYQTIREYFTNILGYTCVYRVQE
ncbi:MAG: hypothetical protein E7161_03515 [Firmicutes bacterium]|nr:hypothetical protein [Bacillota bacterium]